MRLFTAPLSHIWFAKRVPKYKILTIWQKNIIFLAKNFVVCNFLSNFAT